MKEIKLSLKTYYYDPEYRILFEENNRNIPVKTRFLSDEDLKEFYRQQQIIHESKTSNQ